jgi:hypothetical protein
VKGLVRSNKGVCVLHGSRKFYGVIDFRSVPSRPSGTYIYVGRKVNCGKLSYETGLEIYYN